MKPLRERIDTDAVEYTVTIEAEGAPVRGNAQVSGDDADDKAQEDSILAALERGQVEAWCCLVVTATYVDGEGNEYSARDTLGCCSFEPGRSERRLQDAIDDHVQDHGMKEQALTFLLVRIEHAESECEPAARALAQHLGCLATECDERHGSWVSSQESGEYQVLTDSEADAAFKESLESYIDDMQSDWPETAVQYFDSAAWMRDVQLGDGRGPALAGYDGAEEEEQVDGTWYFIYRTN